MTHYQILGVHPDASSHAIKMAYRRLVKIYHPDRAQDAPANSDEKMRAFNEAYAILSKSDKRRKYDETLIGAKPQFSHPTGEAGTERRSGGRANNVKWKSRAEELAEEIHSENFLKRFSGGNRFESKDAFLALTLCFFFMLKPPPGYFNFGNLIVSWPFFGAAILAGLGARFIAGVYFANRFKNPESFGALALGNAAAAVAMGLMAPLIEVFLQQALFAYPIVPALLAAFLPGSIGAGMGRAFNRSVGAHYGLAGGAFFGALISVFFGLWCVVLQLAFLGAGASTSDTAALAKPLKAVVIAAALAGALGSFRMNRLFIFSALDWLESWFERFTPAAAGTSKSLTTIDRG